MNETLNANHRGLKNADSWDLLLNKDLFLQVLDAGLMYANSGMVPAMFKGNKYACAAVVQLALHFQMHPVFLFQNIFKLRNDGPITLSSSLMTALAYESGEFDGVITHEFEGEGDNLKCTAKVKLKTGQIVSKTLTWASVVAEGWLKNSKWKNLTNHMFELRTSAWLIRAVVPQATMGFYTKEELEDFSEEFKEEIAEEQKQSGGLAQELFNAAPEELKSKPVVNEEAKVEIKAEAKKSSTGKPKREIPNEIKAEELPLVSVAKTNEEPKTVDVEQEEEFPMSDESVLDEDPFAADVVVEEEKQEIPEEKPDGVRFSDKMESHIAKYPKWKDEGKRKLLERVIGQYTKNKPEDDWTKEEKEKIIKIIES